jgi:chaperone BCS1
MTLVPVIKRMVRKAAIGYGLGLIKEAPHYAYAYVRDKISIRVVVTNYDSSYYWLQHYLAKNTTAKKTRNFAIMSTQKLRNQGLQDQPEENEKQDWMLVPSTGIYRFVREGAFFTISKMSGSAGASKGSNASLLEAITIDVIGGNKEIIERFLEEARNCIKVEKSTSIHLYNGYWQRVGTKAPRHESTIIMSGGIKEHIFEDLQKFLASRDWYRSRGIPYHRGYLFSGNPGSGKTSMIDAMASKFEKSIATINVGSLKDDDELYDAFLTVPKNSLIALEDIDCITATHKRDGKNNSKHGKEQGITLAGLLNCLDGTATPDGAIVVMTSNHPELLDPALIRPGRADVSVVFHHLTQDEQVDFSKLFYEEPIKGVKKQIAASKLQSIFMQHLEDSSAAQKALEELE